MSIGSAIRPPSRYSPSTQRKTSAIFRRRCGTAEFGSGHSARRDRPCLAPPSPEGNRGGQHSNSKIRSATVCVRLSPLVAYKEQSLHVLKQGGGGHRSGSPR